MKNKKTLYKRFLALFFVFSLSFSNTVSAMEIDPDSLPAATAELSKEYGESESIFEQSANLISNLCYPKTGIANVDKYISGWASDTFEQVKSDNQLSRLLNPRTVEELNTNFNTYLIGERYLGVEIIGSKNNNLTNKSYDIIKTFNISINGKRILSNDEILSESAKEILIESLKTNILNLGEEYIYYAGKVDSDWLDNMVLTHDGIKIILEKGKYLPSRLDTQTFLFPYEDVCDSFKLPARYFVDAEAEKAETERFIDPDKPMVALTFDDGPGPATEKILELLKEYDAKATFCVLGNRVSKYRNLVEQAHNDGHEIIGHSWDHKQLSALNYNNIKKQLEDTNNAIFEITGIMPAFHRPPYGASNTNVENVSKELNMAMLYWSIDPYDWKTKNADATYNAIMGSVKDGSIILCHDIHSATGEAMERVIPALLAEGYQLVTVSELFEYSATTIENGKIYRYAE